jgi:catalase
MATKKLHTALGSFIFLAAIVSPAAQDMSLEMQLLDAMSKLSGVHPGFRANHATGIVVAGSFEATPHAAQLSKAVLFSGNPCDGTFLGCPEYRRWLCFRKPMA